MNMEEMKIEELIRWQRIMVQALQDINVLEHMNGDERDTEFALVVSKKIVATAKAAILKETDDPDLKYL